MSIQSEITRITNKRDASFAAVSAKGVTVPSGSTIDDLPDLIAQIQQGSGSGVVVVDTLDSHGGIIREITAVDLSNDTVDAAHLLSGYTAHDRFGDQVIGSYVPSGPTLQAKTNISPSTSSQTITPDNGYDGLSSVQINAMPNGSATAPASISGTSATVSTGTNTLTLSKTVSVTPSVTAGYVASGTAGDSNVSLTASVTTKAAATITPTKSTQTIASGTYLTGTQTIAAIPAAYQDVTSVTAAAGDVVSGKAIVDSSGTVVNGTLVIQHYYTGSGAPSSSTGVDGDIYLQTS